MGGAPDGPPEETVAIVSGVSNLSVFPSSTRGGGTNDMGVRPTTESSPTRPIIYAVLLSEVRLQHVVVQAAPVRVATTKVSTSAIVPAQDPECTFTTPGAATEVVPDAARIVMVSKIVFSTKVWNLGLLLFSVTILIYSFLPLGSGVEVCGGPVVSLGWVVKGRG